MDMTQNCGCHVYIIPQDMDPPRVGPSIRDVLTRQDAHRSNLLWDAPLAGEEVPGWRPRLALLAKKMMTKNAKEESVMDFHFFYVYYDGETYYHELNGLSYQGSNQKQKCVKVKRGIGLMNLKRRILKAMGLDQSRHNISIVYRAPQLVVGTQVVYKSLQLSGGTEVKMMWEVVEQMVVKGFVASELYVESQLRIMEKCEPGSEIYNDCINALRAVEELGRLTLDDAHTVGNTNEPAVGRGRQAGRRQRQGGRQSSQRPTSSQRQTPVPTSSRHQTPVPTPSRRQTPVPTSGQRHTPVHDHTMEEASQTTDEMCLDIGYDMGSMAHNDAGPSHTFAHGDTSRSPSMRSDDTCPPISPTTSPLPTARMSPPVTTDTAPADVHGRDEMRFMPTPRRPTPSAVPPEFVHTEFIQTQIPTAPPEASHI
ncbi:hypothetical protein CFP56_039472 [Quercus suber]|uniref:Uncharacterized protein n=1 Tax=Quercus suber TaxID=58331 RepID=A0AAW0IZR6_QUESU